jgi:hypothetical protein
MDNHRAIERYRYMLQTAPPEDIERAHVEAFERLSPEQRAAVLSELSRRVPAADIQGDDPRSLARTATRAEMRDPGTMERTFGGSGVPGLGSMFLSTLAGAFIGSSIANAFFDQDGADGGSDAGDSGGADGNESAMGEDAGDSGGGDFGGDFGGGDFGGGDIGF